MTIEKAITTLKKTFGYDTFRPLQKEIIHSVYDKKDTVVIMPTGGGKSICYQIPALTLPGTTVVCSPLIALMKDQVEGLQAAGVRAAFLNSSQSVSEQDMTIRAFLHGELDLLYVSPERLCTPEFYTLMGRCQINLFAIDEAHCISAWGHDFRPVYRKLSFLKKQYAGVPLMALTATADKVTRKDIVRQLDLAHPELFLASFDRPNLRLEVRPGRKRFQQMWAFIQQRPGQSGIIYCGSRKTAESLSAKLMQKGIPAAYYHAGMTDIDRNKVQEAFISDRTPIICATIAFGMGIDKSNIRWVMHYNLPKNIESYYQEIGRAGRDDAPADTLLFFTTADVFFQKRIINDNRDGDAALQLRKLRRLEEYAVSPVCRRKTLLSYFGEFLADNCGNCDVCDAPPTAFDGTVPAQKALSAVYRMHGKANMNVLIDVLRGSRRKEIFQNNFHEIKTYGVGKEHSYEDWRTYIEQLIHQGYLEVALDDHYHLKATPASKAILFENKKVELVQPASIKEREEKTEAATSRQTRYDGVAWDDELFGILKKVRLKLARENNIPPYIIFHDRTLQEMAAIRPVEPAHFFAVSGVGEKKKDRYGQPFLDAIIAYAQRNNIPQEKIFRPIIKATSHSKKNTKSTYDITLELYQKGLSIEEIAQQRQIREATIISHFIHLFENGDPIELRDLIDDFTFRQVEKTVTQMPAPLKLRPIFEALGEEVKYTEIKIALALLKAEGTTIA